MAAATLTNPKVAANPVVAEIQILRIPEAGAIMGLGRTKVYDLIAQGRLASIKIDGARRITLAALREFLAAQNGSGTGV